MNSVACCVTSDSDFDKGGCVIQIEWTKALCNNAHALKYIVQKQKKYIKYLGIRLLCSGFD